MQQNFTTRKCLLNIAKHKWSSFSVRIKGIVTYHNYCIAQSFGMKVFDNWASLANIQRGGGAFGMVKFLELVNFYTSIYCAAFYDMALLCAYQ